MKITITAGPGITPIKKEFVHDNVMFWREEDDRYIVYLKDSKLAYAKEYYSIRRENA